MARTIESKLKKLGFPNTFQVIGDEWIAGNLCYHLKSKPKCKLNFSNEIILYSNNSQGNSKPFFLKKLQAYSLK